MNGPPEVPNPYFWNEIPSLGGKRVFELRRSKDAMDVLHPCRAVHWSPERGIYETRFGVVYGTHATIDDAMAAHTARLARETEKRHREYAEKAAKEKEAREAEVKARFADPQAGLCWLLELIEELQVTVAELKREVEER